MSITKTILGYSVSGPFNRIDELREESGVYVILRAPFDEIIDVGESGNVKTRVENHDRESCWRTHHKEGYRYLVYYTSESHRKLVERRIRGTEDPLCGER